MKAYIPTYLKKQNRTTVLDLFLEHKELTRADVSKLTGISLPTVLKIVDFLRMKQILIDSFRQWSGQKESAASAK